MSTFSKLFLTRGNEKTRDRYFLTLFEKAWSSAEREKSIPGAEDINRQLVRILQDNIKFEDFRQITRLREAIRQWQFSKDLRPDNCRQLAIIQIILLSDVFGDQYQKLLDAIRVRELASCCDVFIRERVKKLSIVLTVPLSRIKSDQITDDDLKLEIRQYQAVLSLRSTLNTESTEQNISAFNKTFYNCRSVLKASSDSLCMQFIRKVLDLLPKTLASSFGFFRTEAQQLMKTMESFAGEAYQESFMPEGFFGSMVE